MQWLQFFFSPFVHLLCFPHAEILSVCGGALFFKDVLQRKGHRHKRNISRLVLLGNISPYRALVIYEKILVALDRFFLEAVSLSETAFSSQVVGNLDSFPYLQ